MISLAIVTFHDVFQRVAAERGVLTKGYQEHSALVLMSAEDMNALGIKDGATVKVSSSVSSVVLQAKRDTGGEPGFGYMPVSLYSNRLSSYQPTKSRLPNFKHITVVVEASNEAITPIADIWNSVVEAGRSDA